MGFILKSLLLLGIMLIVIENCSGQDAKGDPGLSILPLDQTIHYGELENGLTYYIKPLKNPNSKLQMKLFVKVGTFYESKEEQNFAHHIEHLAFKKTRHFPKGLKANSLLLSTLDMHRRNLSGKTGAFFTEYTFEAPTGNEDAIGIGLTWFKDIVMDLDLSENNINEERGVLLQEYRGDNVNAISFNAMGSLKNKLFPCRSMSENFTLHNQTFPYQDLQKFYRKWYRPDRMAVVIVGNIADVDEFESLIKNSFSAIKRIEEDISVPDCLNIHLNSQPKFSVIKTKSDSLFTRSFPISINLFYRNYDGKSHFQNWEGIKSELLGHCVPRVLNKRFNANREPYNSSYKVFSSYQPIQFAQSLRIAIDADLEEEMEAFRNVMLVINQFNKYGITVDELTGLKEEMLKKWDPTFTGYPDYWMNQIRKHYIYDEALPINKTLKVREWIKNLSRKEFNSEVNKIIGTTSEDIGIIVPDNYDSPLDSEGQIRKLALKVSNSIALPYNPIEIRSSLMNNEEICALDINEKTYLEEGVEGTKKLQLKNGLTIILKNLDSSKREGNIFVHGFSPKGASNFPKDDYFSVMYAPSVVQHSGIGKLNGFELERFYKSLGFAPQIKPYIQSNEAGIKAEVPTQNIEEFLQLVYLYFSLPRQDYVAFEDLKNLKLPRGNALNHLLDLLNEVSGDNSHLPYASKKEAAKKRMEFHKVFEGYNSLFGNAKDFTFIITGNFDESRMIPLLKKYLGNLPNREIETPGIIHRDSLAEGPVFHLTEIPDFYNSNNAYYGFIFVKKNRSENENWKEEVRVNTLGAVMNVMVFKLRSREGLSLYFSSLSGKYNRIKSRYEIQYQAACIPEELPLIKQSLWKIIDSIKNGDIPEGVFSEGLKAMGWANKKENWNHPSAIGKRLYEYYRYGESLVSHSEMENYIGSLTIADLAETATKIFKNDNLYEVLMKRDQSGDKY